MKSGVDHVSANLQRHMDNETQAQLPDDKGMFKTHKTSLFWQATTRTTKETKLMVIDQKDILNNQIS